VISLVNRCGKTYEKYGLPRFIVIFELTYWFIFILRNILPSCYLTLSNCCNKHQQCTTRCLMFLVEDTIHRMII
jgi:hypothetical protein